jgi:hypothetical protein
MKARKSRATWFETRRKRGAPHHEKKGLQVVALVGFPGVSGISGGRLGEGSDLGLFRVALASGFWLYPRAFQSG